MARNAFNIGEVWNPDASMVTKLFSSNCGAHILEYYFEESNVSDTNRVRNLFSSYLIKIWLSV